jgi:hypothetical protein
MSPSQQRRKVSRGAAETLGHGVGPEVQDGLDLVMRAFLDEKEGQDLAIGFVELRECLA